MKIGAHLSISDHISNAVLDAEKIKCDVLQIFTKNQQQWTEKQYSTEDINIFHSTVKNSKIDGDLLCSHNSYLINICASKSFLLKQSKEAFINEIIRCQSLGIKYLIFHPGAHVGQGEQVGLNIISDSLNYIIQETNDSDVILLLETTAGQGTTLGYQFEQLAYLIKNINKKNRIGICLDTCHIFAAGYDIRDEYHYQNTFEQFDKIIGLDNLKAFHLNDSKKELGSRVDRHERIGKGYIGDKAFELLMNDQRFRNLPGILEVPGGIDAFKEDILLLKNQIKSI